MSAPLFMTAQYRRQYDVAVAELADAVRRLALLDPVDVHREAVDLIDLLETYAEVVDDLVAATPLPPARPVVAVATGGRL